MDDFADSHSWAVKGDKLRVDEDWPELIKHCQMWLNKYPEELSAQILLGEAYNNTGRYQESMDLYFKVATKRPNDYATWYLLGSLAVKAGKTQEAVDYFSMAVYTNRDMAAAIKTTYPELYQKVRKKSGSNRILRLCVGIIILILFAIAVRIFL
jgi:tetratricopeptide (TPR) repeat protein